MRLNPDCIRDTLLALEDMIQTGGVTYVFEDFDQVRDTLNLNEYTQDEIEYHLRQCDLNGMLVGASFGASGGFTVRDISPKAHEFLANIRSDKVYKTAKTKLSKIGIQSLKALVEVAGAVAADYIAGRLS